MGVPIIRIILLYRGLYWGPLILGSYHIPLSTLIVAAGAKKGIDGSWHVIISVEAAVSAPEP